MWTVQELLVGGMDPLVGFGNQWMAWSSMKSAIFSIVNDGGGGTKWLSFAEQERHAGIWLKSARANFQKNRTSSLSQLVMATNLHFSLDPRDRLFALGGLVEQRDKESIEIDYSLDKSAVYQNTSLALFQQEHALKFPFVNDNIRGSILPTWCIDFSHGRCGPPQAS
jgi:hypothetical protein